jgi:outer membrane immunogenic protein
MSGEMMRAPKKRLSLAGVAALAFSGTSALAADVPVKAPAIKATGPVYDWTGWYGGYNVGVGVSQAKITSESLSGSDDLGSVGFVGGVQAGRNWQLGPNWVVGIEGDLGYLGINRSHQNWFSEFANGIKTGWYGTLRGRFGYANGPTQFYVTGGGAFVQVGNNFDDVFEDRTIVSRSKIAAGGTIGGGIETQLGGNWSAKAEYLHIDAGRQEIFNPQVLPLLGGRTTRFENRFHVFRYGLNHKFDGSGMAAGAMPSEDWTGFYAGVNAGAGVSETHGDTRPIIGSIDRVGAGFTGGVQAGYFWRVNPNWVAGIEGDIGYLGIERSLRDLSDSDFVFGVKTDWYGTVRGRLGYTTGPALLYLTAGAAFVNVRNNFDDLLSVLAAKREIATGWTVGGGIEAVLDKNWTAKTEYLFINAGRQGVLNSSFSPGGDVTRFENRFHVFRFGLNYRFGS